MTDDCDRRPIGQVTYEAFIEDYDKDQLIAWADLPTRVQDAWNCAGEEAAAHWSEQCGKRLAMTSYCCRPKSHTGDCEP